MSSIDQVTEQLHAHCPGCRIEQVNKKTLNLYRSGVDEPIRLKVFESRDHLLSPGTVPASLHPHLRYVGYWRFNQTVMASAEVDFRILVPINTSIAGQDFLILPDADLKAILQLTNGGERFYWDVTGGGKSIASRPLTPTQRLTIAAGHEAAPAGLELTKYVNNWQQLGC